MSKTYTLLLFIFTFVASSSAQQFSDYRFCVDPGHGGHDPANDRKVELPNGIIFWESEGNLMTAFHLDTILRNLGANVKLTRTANDDADDISLSTRSTIANDFGADYFHSIHTNGGDGTANYSLVLFKGETDAPAFSEAKRMADLMVPELQAVLRTTDAYSRGDMTFLGFYLGVLRNATMPSTLSEGAFHDFPASGLRLKSTWFSQNYAWALAKSFLKFYSKAGFSKGRIGGVVTDDYSNEVINGVQVTANPGDLTCLADDNYNGFYALDLTPGNYTLTVSKAGYVSKELNVVISANKYMELDIALTYFNDGKPRADFFVSGLPAGATQSISFDASNSLDPDGSITSYAWDFGDGSTGTGMTTTHAFATDGTYSVNLTVTDNDGKTGSLSKNVSIETKPPQTPVIASVVKGTGKEVKISWSKNLGAGVAYRIYSSNSDGLNDFTLLADEATLAEGTTEYTINDLAPNENGYNFKIMAVNNAGQSDYSDTYAVFRSSDADTRNALIVDGYDRLGSWGKPTHAFANTYMSALRDVGKLNISTSSNEAVENGTVVLSDFDIVVWFLGDESTADETFSNTEQAKVKAFLENGGNLLVSGAEIAWDLDAKGSSSDKSFYNNYLKASYSADGSSGNNPAKGIDFGIFDGVSLNFGQVYPEDYPDELIATGGSENILRYKNGQVAGVAYNGSFGASSKIASIINIAFPLESVSPHSALVDFMQKAIKQFDWFPTGIADLKKKNNNPVEIFPLPAENKLNIHFTEKVSSKLRFAVYDYSGKRVFSSLASSLNQDRLISLDVSGLKPGFYILKINSTGQNTTIKFIKK